MKLTDIPYLSTKRLQALSSEGIHSVRELLNFFPRRYLDRSNTQKMKYLAGSGEEVTVAGRVSSINTAGYGKKKRLEVTLNDGTGTVKGVWFRGVGYFSKFFKEGETVAFFGAAKRYGKNISIAHPEVDKISSEGDLDAFSRIVPIYPGSKEFGKARINSTLVQKWMKEILAHLQIDEFLPEAVRKELNFPLRSEAYRMIHFPETHNEHKNALNRFKFEELLLFQLSMEKIHHTVKERESGHVFTETGNYTARFFNELLPFTLTDGQKSALAEIKQDVRSGKQMNRLIQGDVGAGKTIVAIGAMLMALDNGFQAAFLAPTEILAEQHYRTLSEHLKKLDINVRLLIGSQKKALRTDILTDLAGGGAQIVVGTHAIIQDEVRFHNLGLAVIDEQHRFGVKQRADLLNKGSHPHMLVMSATPIPRSLAMTVYADLDVSVIRDLPAGRKPIRTAIRSQKKREDVMHFVRQEVEDGGQVYVVYPLVEESEALDLKDATAGFEKLKKRFPEFTIGLLHGRMSTEEKEEVMRRFIDHEVQILVSTTVIEVGVDVPNASIMIIEHAERFGLSQLHQLRGRIGRGERQSYCILMPDVKVSKNGAVRLRTMEKTTDGFRIAEADLELRGPGDFLGTKQSGLPDFKHADILEDQHLLGQAKQQAHRILSNDPELKLPEHTSLNKIFTPYFEEKVRFYGLG
ncbi:ATP-dependent DNA helicase RecG [Gracilimonas mengyeensis]|uniref:ATP-dependent DNA helicase RecG n=1 Tax=Gracilimonas mengyeensis TaxID=1302730 RepID=A0A521CAW8_9BACT|nr:ATP-dependent DNA helicase RecG [Gracilimonas mengyeensis]SMO56602.1 ATP-dependent DNA helicase RecG [Gracilimonas mengyeensis]